MTKRTKLYRLMTVLTAASVTAGCGMFSDPGDPKGPNEFEVVARAPLIIPPDSDLRPPRPGQPRPQDIDPTNRALDVLFPEGVKKPPTPSEGEQKLLSSARVGTANADVRSLGSRRDQKIVRKSLVLLDLLTMEEREFQPDNVSITRVQAAPEE